MNFELNYDGVRKSCKLIPLIERVIDTCFEVEGLLDKNLYVNILLTTPEKIKEYNKEYRNIDKSTDVLSFPQFEKGEVKKYKKQDWKELLGDMVINVEQVKKQAKEYGHSFEREFCYMIVHSFYHLMGEDHMVEEEKKHMRKKEEFVLDKLDIKR